MDPSNRILGIYGYSDSGKTTLIEKLTSELSAIGWKVAVIKRSKEDYANISGKDTRRYLQAGAVVSVFSGTGETGIFIDGKINEMQIIKKILKLENYNMIFVEGSRDPEIPKIRIGEIEMRVNTLFTYQNDFTALMEIIINNELWRKNGN